jgi:hypothetical protein
MFASPQREDTCGQSSSALFADGAEPHAYKLTRARVSSTGATSGMTDSEPFVSGRIIPQGRGLPVRTSRESKCLELANGRGICRSRKYDDEINQV